MAKKKKTIELINERIRKGAVVVLTAEEMTRYVKEAGPHKASEEVDVVTTGTFGAMCSSGVFFNFGHSDPPIKIQKLYLNDVEAYSGIAAVDAYLGAAQASETLGEEYGGGHVIEDLVAGRSVLVNARSAGTDCYPSKQFISRIKMDDLNQAILCNPRNSYERYNAAINSSDRTLYTYMGKLLPAMGNIAYSGAGELSPVINDRLFRTLGTGTRILLGGAEGYIIGSGTQHSPGEGFSTLMVKGDLKKMSAAFLKGASIKGYGPSLYIGLGIPIPVLDEETAKNASISDSEIFVSIIDFGVKGLNRPCVQRVSYAELKSGRVYIKGEAVPSSPLSSLWGARKIAEMLKSRIMNAEFYLTNAVEPISLNEKLKPFKKTENIAGFLHYRREETNLISSGIRIDENLCINCGFCMAFCPCGVFYFDQEQEVHANADKCIQCGKCRDICPQKAIIQGK